jgi:uncharacterized protein (DUF4415 family)
MKQQYDFSQGKRGRVVPPQPEPQGKTRITIRLDDELVDWFLKEADKSGGTMGYQTLINDALRQFMEGKAPKIEDTLRRIVREEHEDWLRHVPEVTEMLIAQRVFRILDRPTPQAPEEGDLLTQVYRLGIRRGACPSDDELIKQAQELTGIQEKSALIRKALETLIQWEAARGETMPDFPQIPRIAEIVKPVARKVGPGSSRLKR